MSYVIKNDEYTVDVTGVRGDKMILSIDATDVGQVDELLGLYDYFENTIEALKKRTNKIKKEYEGQENVIARQTIRVYREELEKLNEHIDSVFGEDTSKILFVNKLSIVPYYSFFDLLEKEFEPAINKAQKSIDQLLDKYDLTGNEDEDIL